MPFITEYSFNGPKFIRNGILNSPVDGSEGLVVDGFGMYDDFAFEIDARRDDLLD